MKQVFLETGDRVIGLKQTLRALQQNKAKLVYVANDVDPQILGKIKASGQGKNVEVVLLRVGQRELGKLCQIDVGASVVTVVRD